MRGACRIQPLASRISVAGVVLAVCAAAPAYADMPAGCSASMPMPVADISQPLNLDRIKAQLLYYRCTKYDDDVRSVLADARQWIAARAPQVTHPAIVLDIDETSLSNWTRIQKDDFAYIPNGTCDLSKSGEACGDLAWQRAAQAPAIEPTLELFRIANCQIAVDSGACTRITVFFVTGRYESAEARDWTERNLANAGYHGWKQLYMRDPATRGHPVSEHKIAARIDIERQGFTIVANIGDQDSDLVGDHAERVFKVPNPFYLIP